MSKEFPRHPRTGLPALGLRKDGRPIWPVLGGDGTGEPAGPDTTTSAGDGGTGGASADQPNSTTAAQPKAFDPKDLPPEAQAYLRKAIADADAKSRTGAKENAASAARDEMLGKIAEVLGLKPKEVDPTEVARQLKEAQAEARQVKIDRALDLAARAAEAYEDLVGAVLARKGLLKGLDPSAADFDDKVKALVEKAVADDPRLKLAPVGPAAAAQSPVGSFNGQPNGGQRPGLIQALQNQFGNR